MKILSKLAVCFLLVCLAQSQIFAQTLISTLSLPSANLNASESQRYANLQQDASTKGLQVIMFGNPLDYLTLDGVLQFNLPGFPGPIRAKAVDITTTSTSYSWAGRLLTNNGYFGFYEIQGHRAAWFQADNRFFEIMPLKDNICTLREIDNDILDSGNCFLPTVAQSTNLENELCAKDYNTCTATIDILVLLPNDARIWLVNRFGGDAFAAALYIGIGTQALNLAFANSDIPNKKVNIILENFEMNYPSVGSTCGQLLTALQAQATARRNAVGADLVVLITATDYPCGSGAATAELGDPPFFGDPSFAFSEIRWLFHPRWSMLHEVGHLMGAGHDRPDDNDSDCAHGWTVGGNRFQRTLMARWVGTQNPTDTRILHYSNPDIVYNGDVTGTDEDNNAKVITKLANIKIFEETDPRCDHKRSPRPEFSHTSILWEKLVAAPNPANTTVQVSWLSNTESNIDLAICDGLGRSIFSQHLNQAAGENSHQINIEKLPVGMYTILLRSEKRSLAQKLVVIH